MTTEIVGCSHTEGYELSPVQELITGRDVPNPYEGQDVPEDFDTMRLISLYYSRFDSPGFPKGQILLFVYNFPDYAQCVLDRQNTPILGTAPVYVDINNQLQEISDDALQSWNICEGDILRIWMGDSENFFDRDKQFGYALVTWANPTIQLPAII